MYDTKVLMDSSIISAQFVYLVVCFCLYLESVWNPFLSEHIPIFFYISGCLVVVVVCLFLGSCPQLPTGRSN